MCIIQQSFKKKWSLRNGEDFGKDMTPDVKPPRVCPEEGRKFVLWVPTVRTLRTSGRGSHSPCQAHSVTSISCYSHPHFQVDNLRTPTHAVMGGRATVWSAINAESTP